MNEKELLLTIECKNFPDKVLLSNARRKKYYKEGEKIPKKYSDTINYRFAPRLSKQTDKVLNYLFNNETKEFVIKNPKAQGTPKYAVINGQAIYSSNINKHSRNKMMGVLKDYFETTLNLRISDSPYVFDFAAKSEFRKIYPLIIEADFYYPPIVDSGQVYDLDNRTFIYTKAFLDALKKTEYIADDSIKYITGVPGYVYFPCEKGEHKIIYYIYKDTRSVWKKFWEKIKAKI